MAYDDTSEAIMLFGGVDLIKSYADTWRFDGTTWTELTTPRVPAPRLNAFMAFDSARKTLMLTGGGTLTEAYDEVWTSYRLGGACTTVADCPGAYCVDNVCCGVRGCGTCATCNGASPGQCTAVQNAEDPDTCGDRDGKSCSGAGECKAKRGAIASSAAECASGFLVDGVCCETASCPLCQTCDAAKKETAQYSGQCGATRANADPRNECSDEGNATCGARGVCDGKGACALYTAGSSCGTSVCTGNRASGRVCNGTGACNDRPDGIDCAPYVCAQGSCKAACNADADCASTHLCEEGRCVAKSAPVCEEEHLVKSPDGTVRDCAPYKCTAGSESVTARCITSCERVTDCRFPAECTSDHKCAVFASTEAPSGCVLHGSRSTNAGTLVSTFLAMLGSLALLRRNRDRAGARGVKPLPVRL